MDSNRIILEDNFTAWSTIPLKAAACLLEPRPTTFASIAAEIRWLKRRERAEEIFTRHCYRARNRRESALVS